MSTLLFIYLIFFFSNLKHNFIIIISQFYGSYSLKKHKALQFLMLIELWDLGFKVTLYGA